MPSTSLWNRSLAFFSTDEESGATDSEVDVVVYHPSALRESSTHEPDRGTDAGEFIPDSSGSLVAVLEGMNTPVTVHEVADRLVRPARPSVATWGDVHERLYQDRLPALAAAGTIEFDAERGLVELPAQSREASVPTRFVVAAGCLVLLAAVLVGSTTAIGIGVTGAILAVVAGVVALY